MSIKVTVSGDLGDAADKAAQKAFEATTRELFGAMQQSFTAKAWDWPRDLPTRKLKGATLKEKIASYHKGEGVRAGNPRNLIDVGNLRQTGYYEFTSRHTAKFTWSAEYARFVHEGGAIRPWGNKRAPMVVIPARPWTSAVLGRVTVPGIRPFQFSQRLRDVWLQMFKAAST